MEFEFAIQLQYTHFKWNNSHISGTYIKFQPSSHVFVHCTYCAPFHVVCRVEVEPKQEAAPFVEDPDTEPHQQGKQTQCNTYLETRLSYLLSPLTLASYSYGVDKT